MIHYLSLCSGIEAFSCAVHDMPAYKATAFAEIEPFPCAVLRHHYPHVPNLGDITQIDSKELYGKIDLIVGGTPCQDFSIAGSRTGLAGERSALALHYARLVRNIKPTFILWENVPGCLSTGRNGRDFATFVSTLVEYGYGVAWRILDAQYFGVPQRRRRVFLVGYLGDPAPALKILFEPQSLRWDTATRRETGKEVAKCLTTGIGTRFDSETDTFVCEKVAPTVTSSGPPYSRTGNSRVECDALAVETGCVRRLTPLECERLQGFPDNYTNITFRNKPVADGPRYKALGNSMAVPVMRWIAKRMAEVHRRLYD